jgi:hypothetical protein
MRAKYLVIVYMLLDVAFLFAGGPPLGYFTIIFGALTGFLYSRRRFALASHRKFSTPFTERWFGLRNSYYRWKRRRAARKFEIYMRKQNREVRFDSEGRYIDPDKERDPNDRKWMN